jgi:hypothetical protein
MTTFKILREQNCSANGKAAIRDKRLSLKARGLHQLILSHPDTWEVNEKELVGQSDKDGRDSFRSAIKELLDAGYLEYAQQREGGRFGGGVYNVYESPRFDRGID